MKVKKVLLGILVFVLAFSMIMPSAAFAAWEGQSYIFETDFEDEVAGEAPRSVVGGGYVPVAETDAVLTEGNGGKCIDIENRVRAWFKAPITAGDFYIEFDMNAGSVGGAAVGLVPHSSVQSATKWVMALSNSSNGGPKEIKTYLKDTGNAVSPPLDFGTAEDEDLYTPLFMRNETDKMTYEPNVWQNYKIKLHRGDGAEDPSSVQIWVDGVASEVITGHDYFNEGEKIGGVTFYVNKNIEQQDIKIDEIKIYEDLGEGKLVKYYVLENFEGGRPAWVYSDSGIQTQKIEELTNSNPVITTNSTTYLAFPKSSTGSAIRYRLGFPAINSGKLFIEFDAYTNTGAICLGLKPSTNTKNEIDKMGWIMGMGVAAKAAIKDDAGNTLCQTPSRPYKTYTAVGVSNPVAGVIEGTRKIFKKVGATELNNSESYMGATKDVWQHYKFECTFGDNANGTVKLTVTNTDGTVVESETLEGYTYLNGDTDINGLVMMVTSNGITSTSSYIGNIDNLRVYSPVNSNGTEIVEAESKVFGADKIRVNLANGVNIKPATLNTDTVKLIAENGKVYSAKSVSLIGKSIFIELNEALADGNYILGFTNGLKYSDGYGISIKPHTFAYSAEDMSDTLTIDMAIPEETAKYAAGETASATFTASENDLVKRTATYILAGYKDGALIDVAETEIADTSVLDFGAKTVELLLSKDIDTLKAFVWDSELVPLSDIPATATNK